MFVIIWKFEVKAEHEEEFVRVYGENGDWVELFRKAPGYMGSELHRDLQEKKQYLTIDRWNTEESYKAFRIRWAKDYERIDQRCDCWTTNEQLVGLYQFCGEDT